ncbi:MAG: ABC-type transport protein [Myxococcaceae bacterium]|nr:ABC-type transport protein [Myxococcaceae bacterium]
MTSQATSPEKAAAEPAGPPLLNRIGSALLKPFITLLADIGGTARLLYDTAFWLVRPPYRISLFFEAMEFVGVQSLFIVGLTGLFIGMVFGIQLVDGFRDFGAENQTGAVVALALARELSPVFTGLMVSSRAGSAMSTELGSMRVSDQIDALTTMAVNPIQFLVVPRVFAGLVMLPVLTMLFNMMGILGAWIVCVKLLGLDSGIFFDKVSWFVDAPDLMQGMVKAAAFGLTVSLVACRQGFYAKGGAAGVGQATTSAVVQSAVSILALDYLITSIITQSGN